MKIIVPMAGRGSRLRPHTLTVPKPLIPIAGKPIVQRLVEDITEVLNEKVEEIAFIIGDFGKEVEDDLITIAERLGAKGTIYQQDQPLGTAHAIHCAKDSLEGPVVVAFADTLFTADFKIDADSDGVIWVKQVDDPSAFGVVKLDDDGFITELIEKPQTPVSDLAIIGIYYFKDGNALKNELQYLIDNKVIVNGEYQLTDALENLKEKGTQFIPGKVNEWMDCGNKKVTIETNSKTLKLKDGVEQLIDESALIEDTLIIPPCYIGEGAVIKNSKIGPYVSVGKRTRIEDCNITESLIQKDTVITNANLNKAMIGNNATYVGVARNVSLGDYSVLDFKEND
ncbi:glucose-1-phosphate thymidylyltransferase [Flavobacteriaceae bacterium UJ101]|nr:glucose-1-phosphate thymidylyltransferase [Flavobacteriaceae bacterium UJ101]